MATANLTADMQRKAAIDAPGAGVATVRFKAADLDAVRPYAKLIWSFDLGAVNVVIALYAWIK